MAEKPPVETAPLPDDLQSFRLRNLEMFHSILTTFQLLLPADKAAAFTSMTEKLERAVDDNCKLCEAEHRRVQSEPQQDPRRSRFLLRLLSGRVSHLFTGDKAVLPRSVVEGIDRYLRKAFGEIIYEELNQEAKELLFRIDTEDNKVLWERIRSTPRWWRFVDTILIRILFRFEKFAAGKKTFMTIVEMTMQGNTHFRFTEEHFTMIFEALFAELWDELANEDQRLRWDFMFGDGTSKRLEGILREGLASYVKRKDRKVLGSGRVVMTKKENEVLGVRAIGTAALGPKPSDSGRDSQ